MIWEVRIQYSNGTEQVLRSCKNRETALRYIDALYSQGYPLHVAFIVCPVVSDYPSLQLA